MHASDYLCAFHPAGASSPTSSSGGLPTSAVPLQPLQYIEPAVDGNERVAGDVGGDHFGLKGLGSY